MLTVARILSQILDGFKLKILLIGYIHNKEEFFLSYFDEIYIKKKVKKDLKW
jgi:hypothetical protein